MLLSTLLTTTLLAMYLQPIASLRILAIFPLNSKSHTVVCDELARGLAQRGHQLDVYSHFPPKNYNQTLANNYVHHSFAGVIPASANNMSYAQAMAVNNVGVVDLRDVMDKFGLSTYGVTDVSHGVQRSTEGFISECYLAWGRHLNVPMVGVMPTQVIDWYIEDLGNPFNPAVMPIFGSHIYAPITKFTDRLRNTLIGWTSKFLFAQAIHSQNRLIEQYFGPGYPDVNEMRATELDLVIVNSHHSIDVVRPFVPTVIPAAGLHIVDDDDNELSVDVQKWLDDSEDGCVYFSFGSMILIETFPEQIVKAFYASFENIAPTRVLMKVADPNVLPAGLPRNVMTRSWFPQMQVLKHKNTRAFITHGGLMSTQESIYCGVPMIGIPIFGDQFANVETYVRKGIATAVQLSEIDEHTLTKALKDVLHDTTFERNMDKISRLFTDRPMKPLDTAIYWVEYVARHGKKCLRSPIVDLNWWQANLIDVYGFAIFVLAVVFWLLKLTINRVYSVFCSCDKLQSKKKQEDSFSFYLRHVHLNDQQ